MMYRVRAFWTDKVTGKSGVYEDGEVGSVWKGEDGFDTFMWSDGNYACDCNRAEFFAKLSVGCSSRRFQISRLQILDEAGRVVEDIDPYEV